MKKHSSSAPKLYLGILSIAGWFALIAQFYLTLTTNPASAFEIIIQYFSYFTITTNIIVATYCTILLLWPGSKWSAFLSRQQARTAITVYILVVGIIYNTILRGLWKPKGLQLLVDNLLHSAIPLLFMVYWLVWVPKDQLKWKDFLPWLAYPLIYVVIVLILGAGSGFYPYPFINVTELGATTVLINSLGVALAFLILSLLFIAWAKFISRNQIRR